MTKKSEKIIDEAVKILKTLPDDGSVSVVLLRLFKSSPQVRVFMKSTLIENIAMCLSNLKIVFEIEKCCETKKEGLDFLKKNIKKLLKESKDAHTD